MQITQSNLVWQGESWCLREYSLALPGHTAVTRGIVEHPGSVVLVPVRPSDHGLEVLMIRQYRLALKQTILELPAGTRGHEEDWDACAQRELREETGYRAGQLLALGDIWPAPGFSDERMRLYLAQDLHPAPLPGDVDEAIEVTPHLLADLWQMAQDGRLQDAKSVIGVLRATTHFHPSF